MLARRPALVRAARASFAARRRADGFVARRAADERASTSGFAGRPLADECVTTSGFAGRPLADECVTTSGFAGRLVEARAPRHRASKCCRARAVIDIEHSNFEAIVKGDWRGFGGRGLRFQP
jgi:hypothetical protein